MVCVESTVRFTKDDKSQQDGFMCAYLENQYEGGGGDLHVRWTCRLIILERVLDEATECCKL